MRERGPRKDDRGTRQIVLTTAVDIDRRPEDVWPLLVDWEGLPRWMTEARDVRLVGDRREGVGVEAEATIRIAGITTTDRVRVTRWEPPSVLEVEHLGWVTGRGHMEVGRTEHGVHLFWRETFRPPLGILGWLGMRFLAGTMRRIFQRDLRELKRLAESGP